MRIKKFWGTSENAVRIQIYCAIITYYLVAIVQHDIKLKRSIYEVLRILEISLTGKTYLRDLVDKSYFKNFNVLYGSSEPSLFDCLTDYGSLKFLVDTNGLKIKKLKIARVCTMSQSVSFLTGMIPQLKDLN